MKRANDGGNENVALRNLQEAKESSQTGAIDRAEVEKIRKQAVKIVQRYEEDTEKKIQKRAKHIDYESYLYA